MAEAIRPVLEQHGFGVIGIANNSDDALAAVSVALPDVLVACVWTRRILEQSEEARALSVLASRDPGAVREAIQFGFDKYLAKRAPDLWGRPQAGLGPALVRPGATEPNGKTFDRVSQRMPIAPLTRREREVLALLGEGLGNKEMARLLSLRLNTVRTHLQNLFAKLRVHSRLEAVTLLRQDLARPEAGVDRLAGVQPVPLRAPSLVTPNGDGEAVAG
jgi:DNA-binding NarL/FixJ family response regulator